MQWSEVGVRRLLTKSFGKDDSVKSCCTWKPSEMRGSEVGIFSWLTHSGSEIESNGTSRISDAHMRLYTLNVWKKALRWCSSSRLILYQSYQHSKWERDQTTWETNRLCSSQGWGWTTLQTEHEALIEVRYSYRYFTIVLWLFPNYSSGIRTIQESKRRYIKIISSWLILHVGLRNRWWDIIRSFTPPHVSNNLYKDLLLL